MSVIERLWFATITRPGKGSGTDSPIDLVVNTNGVDRLNQLIPLSAQKDFETGQANLHELDVTGAGLDIDELNNSSIRVTNHGTDAWAPEFVFIWGENRRGRLRDPDIEPMGMEASIETVLTVPASVGGLPLSRGVPSMPIRLIAEGDSGSQITRVMLLVTTAGHLDDHGLLDDFPIHLKSEHETGTRDLVELEIDAGGLVLRAELPRGPQLDLKAGQANIYFLPAIVPFTRAALNSESITLRIKGDDAWSPQSFFLFGLDSSERPDSVVPLVHIPEWGFGLMSTDNAEGEDLITLPVLGARDAPPVGGTVIGGSAIGGNA